MTSSVNNTTIMTKYKNFYLFGYNLHIIEHYNNLQIIKLMQFFVHSSGSPIFNLMYPASILQVILMAKKLLIQQLEQLVHVVVYHHLLGRTKESSLIHLSEFLTVINSMLYVIVGFGPKYKNKIARTLMIDQLQNKNSKKITDKNTQN